MYTIKAHSGAPCPCTAENQNMKMQITMYEGNYTYSG